MAPKDGINGEPGVMAGTQMLGPTGTIGHLTNGAVDLKPGMEEGKAYAKKDSKATDDLMEFVAAAARSFEAYDRTAKDAGHNYEASDHVAADGMQDIEKIAGNYIA